MPKALTHDEFIKRIQDKYGDDYTILGIYKNNKTKIRVRHKCDYEYDPFPSSLLDGHECSKCSGNNNKTPEEFNKEVHDLYGGEYEVLSPYVNSITNVDIKHKCGNVINVRPDSFLQKKSACKKCQKEKKRQRKLDTTESFKQKVFNMYGDEYTVLGEYKGTRKTILIRHEICKEEYGIYPNSLLSGSRCEHCYGTPPKTHEKFVQEVFDLVGNEYSVIGTYEKSDIKLMMKHNECGGEYPVMPNKFLQGRRCPKCNQSKGEKAIK